MLKEIVFKYLESIIEHSKTFTTCSELVDHFSKPYVTNCEPRLKFGTKEYCVIGTKKNNWTLKTLKWKATSKTDRSF